MNRGKKGIFMRLGNYYGAKFLFILLLLCIPFPFLFYSTYRGPPGLHSGMEMVGGIIGLVAGYALITRFYALGNRFHLVVGLAFFVNAAEDFVHGFLDFAHYEQWLALTQADISRCIPGTYVSGRLMMGMLLILAPFVPGWLGSTQKPKRETIWMSLTALLLAAVATFLAFRANLPQFVFPSRTVSRPLDLGAGVVFVGALVIFVWKYRYERDAMVWWIELSICANIAGQVMMTFSKVFDDAFFDMAHVYKVLGYTVPLLGFSLYQIATILKSKQAGARLERYATELESANEEVKQFAYIVSHDLRAPLVNLKGFTAELRSALEGLDAALELALPRLEENQRKTVAKVLRSDIPEALGFIDSSASRMDGYVNAVLRLSRLGHNELHFEPLDMDEIVGTTLKSIARQLEERQTKVTVSPLPGVVADRTAMEQIMGNILTNAVIYLDPGRAGKIEIGGKRDDGETTFFVRDNGRGIAAEDLPKVFAPFRRAGKQDIPGEGMGMAYVQALIRRHEGQIRCESQLGVGTTFTFTLPNT